MCAIVPRQSWPGSPGVVPQHSWRRILLVRVSAIPRRGLALVVPAVVLHHSWLRSMHVLTHVGAGPCQSRLQSAGGSPGGGPSPVLVEVPVHAVPRQCWLGACCLPGLRWSVANPS